MNEYKPGIAEIFLVFAKVSTFTLGGGLAMIPLLHTEIAFRKKWITSEEFIDFTGISQSFPGTFIGNLATVTGYKLRGISGAVAGLLGAVFSPFLIMLVFAVFFSSIHHYPAVAKVFAGLRPAVIGMIGVSVVLFIKKSKINLKNFLIPVLIIYSIVWQNFPVIYVMISALVLNMIFTVYKSRGINKNDIS
ncbi:MAG: chromate transporter [Candidatus Muiribacteriota bacterium]|jgi:chromate transporter